MEQALTLARPYARAAFETASSHGDLDGWGTRLAFAAEAVADPQVAGLLGDPRVVPAQLAALVLPEGEPADSPFARFVALLAENARLEVLPEIAALYATRKREAEHRLKVHVTSAAPMDAAAVAKLESALKRRFNCDIDFSQSVDQALIGGALIDAGDVVIDGSVRGRLARLEQALAQ
jgi:F-type H+-transporting ATPase subunit delta